MRGLIRKGSLLLEHGGKNVSGRIVVERDFKVAVLVSLDNGVREGA